MEEDQQNQNKNEKPRYYATDFNEISLTTTAHLVTTPLVPYNIINLIESDETLSNNHCIYPFITFIPFEMPSTFTESSNVTVICVS